jgi:hypothetical protein
MAAKKAAQAVDANAQTTTYYPYAALILANGSSFLAYTGTPVEQSGDAPENALVFPPRTITTSGIRSYFDGIGWAEGPDVTTMTLAQLQGVSLSKANLDFETAVDTLNASYPSHERASWTQQLTDSQLVLNGGAASALLSALATARGTDVKTLATKIVAKNEEYTAAYAAVLASYQKLRATIEDATEIGELPPLTVQDIAFNF